jgi:hypothetical protein
MNAPQAVTSAPSPSRVAAYTLEILPGEFEGKWADAMAWAKEQGGDLPTRIEQIHLFNHARDEFEPDWYWSNEQFADERSAWYQGFNYGEPVLFNRRAQSPRGPQSAHSTITRR